MPKVLNVLTRKFGPLPAWAWPAVGVGGFLVYRYLKNRNAAAAQPSQIPVALGDMSVLPSDNSMGMGGFNLPIAGPPPVSAQTSTSTGSTGTTDTGSGSSASSSSTAPSQGWYQGSLPASYSTSTGGGPNGQRRVTL